MTANSNRGRQGQHRQSSTSERFAGRSLHRILSGHHLDDQSVYHTHVFEDEEDEQLAPAQDVTGLEKVESPQPLEQLSEDEKLSRKATMEGAKTREGEAQVDLEAGLEKSETTLSRKKQRDPSLVTWDSATDPANPLNWSKWRKRAAIVIVSFYTFASPVASSMVAPSLSTIARDFGITSTVESQLVLSIFVLAYAFGPLIVAPLSELFGRAIILHASNFMFLCFNLGCGAAKTKIQMFVFRFLGGLGGSAPLAIGGAVLTDCFKPEDRGIAIAIYSLMPLLGPAMGPIAGGFITEHTSWRWSFWATSILTAIVQVFGMVFLRETYAPRILQIKAAKLRKETGNAELHTEFEEPDKTLGRSLATAMARPCRMLVTQPIVIVLAVYMAFIYGLMYLVLSTFPVLFVTKYRQSIGISGLNFISIGLGFLLGVNICAPITDLIYRRMKARNGGVGRPEFRVPPMLPGALLVPIGLFWYGWSAQKQLHWIMPNLGVMFFSMGTVVGFQCVQTYLVDTYMRYAASAVAAAAVLRSVAGFAFPLFAPRMYEALGLGWGNSLLAFVALGIGVPAPLLLWKYGEWLRGRSKFAAEK